VTRIEKLQDRLKAEVRHSSELRKELELCTRRLLELRRELESCRIGFQDAIRAAEQGREGLVRSHQAEADSSRRRIEVLQRERAALLAALVALSERA
jgi:hypothetical protein